MWRDRALFRFLKFFLNWQTRKDAHMQRLKGFTVPQHRWFLTQSELQNKSSYKENPRTWEEQHKEDTSGRKDVTEKIDPKKTQSKDVVLDGSVLALFLTDFHFSLLFYEFFWRLMGINEQAISGAMALFFSMEAFYTGGWWGFLFCFVFFHRAIGIKIERSANESLPNVLSSTRKKRKQAWRRVDGQSGQLCTVLGFFFFLASLMTVSPVELFLRGSHMVELLACYLFSFISNLFWPVPQPFRFRLHTCHIQPLHSSSYFQPINQVQVWRKLVLFKLEFVELEVISSTSYIEEGIM